jgi:hypothetical protein
VGTRSSVFGHGQPIPSHYKCEGNDISPPLEWHSVLAGGDSLALFCDDPDGPSFTGGVTRRHNAPVCVSPQCVGGLASSASGVEQEEVMVLPAAVVDRAECVGTLARSLAPAAGAACPALRPWVVLQGNATPSAGHFHAKPWKAVKARHHSSWSGSACHVTGAAGSAQSGMNLQNLD